MPVAISPRAGRLVTALTLVSAALVLGVAVGPAAADDAAASDDADRDWYDRAEDAAQSAEETDWDALAEAAGCTLVDVVVSEVVSPEVNEALGAPDDLALPVVERVEQCGSGSVSSRTALSSSAEESRTLTAAADGTSCSTTDGPGTVCVSRSGSYITTSFQYRGTGTIKAFLKLYDIPTSQSGCPTGDTLATGSTASYTEGTRRTLSLYAPGYGGFSAHVWKYVGLGVNTDWGGACAAL